MVYVDDFNAEYGRMIMCHMQADTTDELLAMADKIGVQRKWLQKAGHPTHEHFDICLTKKALAIQHGATAMTWRELGAWRAARRRAANASLQASARSARRLQGDVGQNGGE